MFASELCLIARLRPRSNRALFVEARSRLSRGLRTKRKERKSLNRSSKTAEFVKAGSMRELRMVCADSGCSSVRTVFVRRCGQCLFVGTVSVCSLVRTDCECTVVRTESVRWYGQRVSVGADKSVSVRIMQDKSLVLVFVKRRHKTYAFIVELV